MAVSLALRALSSAPSGGRRGGASCRGTSAVSHHQCRLRMTCSGSSLGISFGSSSFAQHSQGRMSSAGHQHERCSASTSCTLTFGVCKMGSCTVPPE
eukprot:365821-Chlamydomonas_euryale.AAC.3